MKCKLALTGLILILLTAGALCHELITPAIIDTDAALDDIRAIILLLQSDNFDIRAIVTSDGACSPAIGAANISQVLKYLGESEIKVGSGKALKAPAPPWRGFSENMWEGIADSVPTRNISEALTVLSSVLNESDQQVIYICLGPLTNLAELIAHWPESSRKIASVYYRGLSPDDSISTWNTTRDVRAAEIVTTSQIPLYFFAQPDSCEIIFNSSMFGRIADLNTPAADLIQLLHSREPISRLVESGHFRAWDEDLVLSLIYPNLAEYAKLAAGSNLHIIAKFDTQAGYEKYLELLQKGDTITQNIRTLTVLAEFPISENHYQQDVRAIAADAIEKHGQEEWAAAVLASEMHGHLGIYSILGVKMGMRAREILDADLDELQIISYAGITPPLSCLNDGLQVATGATLGHGAIRVVAEAPRIAATFTKNGRAITIRLKDEISRQIEASIENTLKQSGGLNEVYFRSLRQTALHYWLELDRDSIFIIENGR